MECHQILRNIFRQVAVLQEKMKAWSLHSMTHLTVSDLSYFEDFVQFHKTFYKQVEPLSVTPFAENALDKMLFTLILAYFRHTTPYTSNNAATAFN